MIRCWRYCLEISFRCPRMEFWLLKCALKCACAIPGEFHLSEAALICSVKGFLEISWSPFFVMLCQCEDQIPQAVIQRAGKSSYSFAWPSDLLGSEDYSTSQAHFPPFSNTPSTSSQFPEETAWYPGCSVHYSWSLRQIIYHLLSSLYI